LLGKLISVPNDVLSNCVHLASPQLCADPFGVELVSGFIVCENGTSVYDRLICSLTNSPCDITSSISDSTYIPANSESSQVILKLLSLLGIESEIVRLNPWNLVITASLSASSITVTIAVVSAILPVFNEKNR